MQLRIAKFLFINACCCFSSLILISLSSAQSTTALFEKVERSVVKVRCPDKGSTATGFVWKNKKYVVSALHVVDGSANILIYYPLQKVSRKAKLIRLLKSGDLVLLEIENAPDVPFLTHSTQIPEANEEIHTLGFPFNSTAINNISFKLRYGGRRLRDNISEKVLEKLNRNGYPDPDLDILKLGQESLLPGMSGSPIFNKNGQVLGIGDGGLEEGAINISWGIPAENLDKLFASKVNVMPNSRGTKELFASELRLNLGDTKSSGNITLLKIKTRTFSELVSTADDILGLNQLSAVFANFSPANFIYDIYQDVNSGATFVLPHGVAINPKANGFWEVSFPHSTFNISQNVKERINLILQVKQTISSQDGQNQSVNFENTIIQRNHPVTWQPDNSWSYLVPITRFDGVIIRRKAAYGYIWMGNAWATNKYMFETLALKSNTFLGIAVIDRQSTPQNHQMEALCAQGFTQDNCKSLFEFRKIWAQTILGIQLTSFSL